MKLRTTLVVVLTAVSACKKSDPVDTTTTPVATTVTLSSSSISLSSLGETEQLTATVLDQDGATMSGASVTWSSSNAGAASVTNGGLVRAVDNGDAVITATSGSATATAAVAVEQVPASIELDESALSFVVLGDTARITATVLDAGGTPIDGASVTWSTSDGAVATVDGGLVTAVQAGSATITATSGSASAEASADVSDTPLVSCAFAGSGGDRYFRGFYHPDFPADALSAVEMRFNQVGTAERTLTLVAREGTFDGAVIGESDPVTFTPPEVSSGSNAPVIFEFTDATTSAGSVVTFALVLEAGADDYVYYDVGDAADESNCPMVQTNGTTPPLDTARRGIVGIKIW